MIKWFRKRINNQKGFSMIELIVVIAIIAILAGIAVPSYNTFTASAKERADMASLRTLNQATMLYRIQNPATDPFSGAAGGEITSADPEYDNLMNALTASNYLDKPIQPQAAGAGYIWSGDSEKWLYTKNVSTAVMAGSPAIPASTPVVTDSTDQNEPAEEDSVINNISYTVWAEGETYVENDVVLYKGLYYKVRVKKTKHEPINPGHWMPLST